MYLFFYQVSKTYIIIMYSIHFDSKPSGISQHCEWYKILKYSEALKYSEGNFSLFKNIGKLTKKHSLQVDITHSPREV